MSDLLGGRGGRPLRIMLVALLKRLPKLESMAHQARRLADALNHQAFEAGEMHPRIGPGSYTRAAQEMTEDADALDGVVAFLGGVMEAEPPADPRIGFDEGGLSFTYDRGPRVVRLSAAVETFMPQGAFLAHPMDGIRVVVWSEVREDELTRWTGWLWLIRFESEGGTLEVRAAESVESPQDAARDAVGTLQGFIIKAVRTAVEGEHGKH